MMRRKLWIVVEETEHGVRIVASTTNLANAILLKNMANHVAWVVDEEGWRAIEETAAQLEVPE